MTWSAQAEQSNQSAKIMFEVVPYMHGSALDIGGGAYKVFPHFVGLGLEQQMARHSPDITVEHFDALAMFGSQQFTCVYSAFTLNRTIDWKKALRDWWRIVALDGHLCLYLPHADHDKGEQDLVVKEHKFRPEDIAQEMMDIGQCDLIVNETRIEDDEYGFWQVYRKLRKQVKVTAQSWKLPKPAKTCAVVRLGAFGDMIQASSILPWLKAEGYHITLYCSPAGKDIVRHDPHIDRFIVQGKDEVPPQILGEFWAYTAKKYDKWINLSGSVEGTLLPGANYANHSWPKNLKKKYMDRNYLEWTHELAEVPAPYAPKFYSTLEEKAWARQQASRMGRKNILWSLSGSSIHKAWPWLDEVIKRILGEYEDVDIVLVGDEFCRILQAGWDGEVLNGRFVEKQMHPRVHCKSARWTIRQSMAFAEVADLIVGTETGLLNMAGSLPAPKIVTLSHSSQEMLTKHWVNVTALEPYNVHCFPCRQLHEDWKYCWKHEPTGTAMCQADITADQMWTAIQAALQHSKVEVAA